MPHSFQGLFSSFPYFFVGLATSAASFCFTFLLSAWSRSCALDLRWNLHYSQQQHQTLKSQCCCSYWTAAETSGGSGAVGSDIQDGDVANDSSLFLRRRDGCCRHGKVIVNSSLSTAFTRRRTAKIFRGLCWTRLPT